MTLGKQFDMLPDASDSTGTASLAGYRRPDVILYINGIPLVFIELKNSIVKLKSAFDDNLTNYNKDIPQVFHAGVLIVLSNAVETKIGSASATWEYFFYWLRPDDEKEQIEDDQTNLERLVDGLLDPPILLDYVKSCPRCSFGTGPTMPKLARLSGTL